MKIRRLLGLLFLASAVGGGGLDCQAAPGSGNGVETVHLVFELTSPSQGAETGVDALVVLTPAERGERAETAEEGAGRSLLVEVPGRAAVQLPTGSVWRIRTEATGYWAPEAAILVVADAEAVRVQLHPAGRLQGRVRPAERHSDLPNEVTVSFQPPASEPKQARPEGEVRCPVAEDGSWSCTVPTGVHDLRIKAAGFASAFRWEVPVSKEPPTVLEDLVLQEGAALFGFVEADGAPVDPERVRVALRLVRPAHGDGVSSRRLETLGEMAGIDARGFFQFRDLVPGEYRVAVDAEGYAPLLTPPVSVLPGLETDLARPLFLQEPARLRVWVDPPIHPTDKLPWQVVLLPRDPDQEPSTAETGEDGSVLLDGLAAGSWQLHVEGADEARWEDREVLLQPGLQTVSVELPLIPVEGKLVQGDDPVRARITFGDPQGERTVSMVSDPLGRFRGALPHEGIWPVSLLYERGGAEQVIEPVEIARSGSGPVEIEIEVPDTLLTGRVVDSQGRPVADAKVSAHRPDYQERTRSRPELGLGRSQGRSDEEGRFRLRGVAAGHYKVDAARGQESGQIHVEVREGQPATDVEIVLRGVLEVRGRVLSSRGPVAGAHVQILPDLGQNRLVAVPQVATGPLGELQARIPADTVRLHLLVLPFGHAVRFVTWTPQPGGDGEIEIQVDDLGGTLVVDRSRLPNPYLMPFLEHGGTRFPLAFLQSWLVFHGGSPDPGGPWVLPGMPVGNYRLCAPPPSGACAEGTLLPGDRLSLQVPEPSPPTQEIADTGKR